MQILIFDLLKIVPMVLISDLCITFFKAKLKADRIKYRFVVHYY